VAYVVLAISTVLDLVSFRQSAGQLIRRARRYHREFLEESRVTSEPSLRAVFLEDMVSIAGDVIAFAALALNQITGSSIPQGVAAVLIALVMIRVSLRLIQRSHDPHATTTALAAIWDRLDAQPCGWDRYARQAAEFHLRNARAWASAADCGHDDADRVGQRVRDAGGQVIHRAAQDVRQRT
jgi:hypothetical protein